MYGTQVRVGRRDFLAAQRAITPASHRSAAAHARPLAPAVAPCLARPLASALARVISIFPPAQQCLAAAGEREGGGGVALVTKHVLAPYRQSIALTPHPCLRRSRSLEEALVRAFVQARRPQPWLT